MAVNLILWVQEVDISSGHHWLAHLMGELYDGSVKVSQLLLVPRHGPSVLVRAQHKGVVADGLDLQVIIPGGNPFELRPGGTAGHRLEELPCLAGRAHKKSLSVLVDEAFGHHWVLFALKVFQMGFGYQLIEIAQTGLISGQDNEMPGPALSLSFLIPLCRPTVDGIQ